jgi:hypothetical protein
MFSQKLHAVTDAKYRDAKVKKCFFHCGCPGVINGFGATRENNPPGRKFFNSFEVHVKRMQLAVYMGFTDPPCNQLGVLGTEIKDEYIFAVDVHY